MNTSPSTVRRLPGRFFTLVGLLCSLAFPATLSAQTNHCPTIGYVPDQRIISGSFAGQSVTVGDDLTALNSLNVTVVSSNSSWYAASNVVVSTTGATRTITFNNTPTTNGTTTITLTVTDGSVPAKSSATAFTLQRATTASKTTLQRVPNWTMPVNTGSPTTAYGPATWVVMDTDTDQIDENDAESAFTFEIASSNTTLVPISAVSITGQNYGRNVTVTPATNQSGRATITITATDYSGDKTSTAFVLDVVSGSPSVPAISNLPTFHRQTLPATNGVVSFTVTSSSDRVTAFSSNQTLVPNTGLSLGGSGTSRNVTVTPGTGTGAATITLKISGGDITREAKFLYVVYDASAAINEFARSAGVFTLDGKAGGTHNTPWGEIDLRDANMPSSSDTHVTGFTLRVGWRSVESPSAPGTYDFTIIENALDQLPAGKLLSIILVPPEPAYIATGAATTWNDEGTTRAVPWDSYILARRTALIEAMAAYQVGGVPLAVHPRLAILDPYLPGGHTGIRDPNSADLSTLPGYSRANLLSVVQQDLRDLQDNFPGKVVQIGFWKVLDGAGDAWIWLRQELLAEFDDVDRPRVGFFMENLAAKRSVPEAAYSSTPVTSYGQALYDSRNDTWTAFQMLGSWTAPFKDGHVTNTINGTPYEAMEAGYNTYNSRYTEVYIGDINNAAFKPALQGWRDFLASIAAPEGLTALPTSSTTTSVAWNAVSGATSYTLQRRTVGGTFSPIYTGSTASYDDSGLVANTEYFYRVSATMSAGTTAYSGSFPATTYATVTIPSTAGQDGWVREGSEFSNTGATLNSTALLVIGDTATRQQYKAIASFTTALPAGAVIKSATLKLRRNSASPPNPFTTHNPCYADIHSSGFGGSATLNVGDFEASATATQVATMSNPAANGDWSTGTLNATGLSAIPLTGTVQFRVYFSLDDDGDSVSDTVSFNAGDDGNPSYHPVLVLEYQP